MPLTSRQRKAARAAAKRVLKQQPSSNGDEASEDASRDEKRPTQVDNLLALAAGASYVHTSAGKAFALVQVGDGDQRHTETLAVRTNPFRNWLARQYYKATGKAASAKSTEDVLRVLEANATFDGPERVVNLRVAGANGKIYVDLANERWETVAVDVNRWRIIPGAVGPLFRRPRGSLPLPRPVRGGKLDDLRLFLNVTYSDWLLVVAFLVQAVMPQGPYPVLGLYGEQGAAKSTSARVLRSLLDPNAAPLRSQPRDERDLGVRACTPGPGDAKETLAWLPGPGESLHALCTARMDLTDVINALIDRLGPCDRLLIATLGYNERNLAAMLRWLDGGVVRSLILLASIFFRSHKGALWSETLKQFRQRRQRAACCHSHANAAWIALIADWHAAWIAGLHDWHDWHAAWIDQLVSKHEGHESPS
jgi:hypothetical protein